jgi:hypothetical protein
VEDEEEDEDTPTPPVFSELEKVLSSSDQTISTYLVKTLHRVKQFYADIENGYDEAKRNQYPPIVVLTSRKTPTVRGCMTSSREAIAREPYKDLLWDEGEKSGHLYPSVLPILSPHPALTIPTRFPPCLANPHRPRGVACPEPCCFIPARSSSTGDGIVLGAPVAIARDSGRRERARPRLAPGRLGRRQALLRRALWMKERRLGLLCAPRSNGLSRAFFTSETVLDYIRQEC